MMKKCYNKTHNKALRDSNLKGLLINNSLLGVIMTASNNTRNIERGQSSKPHLMYGVAYNSQRKHKATKNGKMLPAYQTWRDMIRRCYCPKVREKHPSYEGCSVDERWHDFQDFADWFHNHPYSSLKYHLDKDILMTGSKVYSPETCCFIPRDLNNLLLDHARARGDCPQGVIFRKDTKKYSSMIRVGGKTKRLGDFNCPYEAHKAYKVFKERYVKNKALEWANRIEWNVFVALMNWSLPNV